MGFYLFHFFSTHFLQWLVEKNNYISMHKLPIICLGQQSLIFNLRLWFWEVFLSFLWWLLHCVTVDIPIFSFFPFLSHSRTLLFYSLWSLHFLQTCQISEWNVKKKFLMVLQGIKVWSLSGLSSGSSLKFALSRLINFLISCNNTNSKSGSNVMRRKETIRSEGTIWPQRYCHNTCMANSKVLTWLCANKLSLNIDKSNFVIFHPIQRKLPKQVMLSINNQMLTQEWEERKPSDQKVPFDLKDIVITLVWQTAKFLLGYVQISFH